MMILLFLLSSSSDTLLIPHCDLVPVFPDDAHVAELVVDLLHVDGAFVLAGADEIEALVDPDGLVLLVFLFPLLGILGLIEQAQMLDIYGHAVDRECEVGMIADAADEEGPLVLVGDVVKVSVVG